MDPQELTVTPPFLLFDDDDWLEIYESVDRMLQDLEYPAIDEVLLVVDGNGSGLRLKVVEEDIVIDQVVDTELAELLGHAERFFAHWTDDDPPPPTNSTATYVASVAMAYKVTRTRSKRRDTASGAGGRPVPRPKP